MQLIGIEEHFLTAEVRDAWNAIALDAVDPSVAFHSGAIESRLLDLADERLALMKEIFLKTPLALNVAYVSWGEDGLWDRLGWKRPAPGRKP